MSIIRTVKAFYPLAHWMTKSYLFKAKNKGKFPPPVRNEYMTKWARETCTALNLQFTVKGEAPATGGTLMVGNHISYLDIPLLMSATPCVFVAKSEIKRWPIVAQGCNVIGVIYVKRGGTKRVDNRRIIGERVRHGDNVVIFPSGTTTMDESPLWKNGPFHIAKEYNLPIQPFRLTYEPLRLAAYIDDDMLVTSVYNVMARPEPIIGSVEFGPIRYVENIHETRDEIQSWCREILPYSAVAHHRS